MGSYKPHADPCDFVPGIGPLPPAELAPSASRRATWLEAIYERFHKTEYRGLDPITALDRYADPKDREITGLVAASLAYGNVKAILKGIENVEKRWGAAPHAYLRDGSPRTILSDFRGFRYRVTSGEEMGGLLVGVRRLVEEYGSLNACFVDGFERAPSIGPGSDEMLVRDAPLELSIPDKLGEIGGGGAVKRRHGPRADAWGSVNTVVPALGRFVDALCAASDHRLYHLLPHPSRGSACKRLMLYLRWMVRRDEVDPGGWTGVSPAQLVVPLDTHLHRMARRLRFTRRRQPNLRTALEITAAFRRIVPDDPLRYDFALTRPGIMRVAPPHIRSLRSSPCSTAD